MTLKAGTHVRVKRILDELEDVLYRNRGGKLTGPLVPAGGDWNITDITFVPGDQSYGEAVEAKGEPFPEEGRWGGRDVTAWFMAEVTIPEGCAGKAAVLYVSTDHDNEWNATNPQFLCFVDGRLRQGLDTNHREVLLADPAEAGKTYRVFLKGWSGLAAGKCVLRLRLLALDRELESFCWNLRTPWEAAGVLEEGDENRALLLEHLNRAINLIDLRDYESPAFMESVRKANRILEKEFYGKACGIGNPPVIDVIGHTHIDVAWQWRLCHTRQKAIRSFASMLEWMRQDPDFCFMSSQPQLYEFVREEQPELFEEIKRRAAQGRWEAEGAMWLEADCNLSGGEALVRQILYGKAYFRKEFGVENEVLWLPDVFGYSAALPQILQKCGVPYFMTTKITWNQYNQMPYDTFMWRGIDGTEVLAYYITTLPKSRYDRGDRQTTYNGKVDADSVLGSWVRYQNKEINRNLLLCYGYGDGGGGPTREALEQTKRLERGIPGIPKVRRGKALDFFRRLDAQVRGDDRLPTWVGELYLEYHRGTYTSMARNKKYNRKAELLLQRTEKFLSLLPDYPAEEMRALWRTLLLNQFHDILPGSSIREVYEDSREQYEALLLQGSRLLRDAQQRIAERVAAEGEGVVVFNGAPVPRADAVFLPGIRGVLLDGTRELPCQVTPGGTWSALPEVPGNGYRALGLRRTDEMPRNSAKARPVLLENVYFRLLFAHDGTLESIYDKTQAREVLQDGRCGNVLEAFEDKPMNYDAWDIEPYYQEKRWVLDGLDDFYLEEAGPVRTVAVQKRTFGHSSIMQRIILWERCPRIDFETTIDWKEKQILLKAAFPVDVCADHADYAIQYGAVSRPTHQNTSWDKARFESCAHQWADLSEPGYGVSLLNDCKYGYDIRDQVLRLTLLKSAVYPNETADREVHTFTYSLYPHAGGWREGGTVAEAARLNTPAEWVPVHARSDGWDPMGSVAIADCRNILVEAVKEAEDGQGSIVRLYDCEGRRSHTRVSFFRAPKKIILCDMLERPIRELPMAEAGVELTVMPFEIVTLRCE